MADILQIKARLLEKPYLRIKENLIEQLQLPNFISSENLYATKQIFIKLQNNCKVRLNILEDADYELIPADNEENCYQIVDRTLQEVLISPVSLIPLEDRLLHSPGQALFNLYKSCSKNCIYCPLPLNKEKTEFLYRDRFIDEIKNLDISKINGIGFTSGIPAGWSYDDLIEEMVKIIIELRKKYGQHLTISAAPPPVSKTLIKKMYDAGLSEIRINMEVYNRGLFDKLCPGYDFDESCESIINAAKVFGKNRVSTNMVIGVGESDEDVCAGIEFFAQWGVVSTLSPLDIIPARFSELRRLAGDSVKRPDWKRLYYLALRQKEIYERYGVNPSLNLRTMCSVCSSCNITPFIDF